MIQILQFKLTTFLNLKIKLKKNASFTLIDRAYCPIVQFMELKVHLSMPFKINNLQNNRNCQEYIVK